VTIESRLDPVANLGLTPPNFKLSGPYASGLQNCVCDVPEGHIGAVQIFPLLKYDGYTTPTVKHHCPKTAAAASLRACSNKVEPDEKFFSEYTEYFNGEYTDILLGCLDLSGEVGVCFETWLSKDGFDEGYRKKMRQATHHDYLDLNLNGTYDAFAKIEMQYTSVPHAYKETAMNEVKERQICGPKDQKKWYANPFIYFMEGVAHEHFKDYCGRKNWEQICADIHENTQHIPNIIYGAADGSGFDMTQLIVHNQNLHKLLKRMAAHKNVVFRGDLSKEKVQEALDCSLKLNVSVDFGNLKYTAQGRASGDGWTTFGNTVLMISYWKYCFKKAGIKTYFLRVKGDDVIFAFDRDYLDVFNKAVAECFTTSKEAQAHGLGQICKTIKFGSLWEIDFLSACFGKNEDGTPFMMRMMERLVQTLSWSAKMLKGYSQQYALLMRQKWIDSKGTDVESRFFYAILMDRARQLIYDKGMCMLAYGAQMPIVRELALKLIQLGRPGKFREFDKHSDGARKQQPKEGAYESGLKLLELKYGICRNQVAFIIKQIDSITGLTGTIHIPAFAQLYPAFSGV